MININHLAMHQAGKLLYDDVSLMLKPNQRYALVGANGTGKSTFLHLLSGDEEESLGQITIAKSARLGVLSQDHYQYEDETVLNVVLQGRPELWNALAEKQKLLSSEEWTDEIGYQLGDIEEKIATLHGYSAEALAHKILIGLGIKQAYHEQPMSVLSGGYKMRAMLAQLLFKQPDILLLDEPTNHLDIVSIAWLEKYLVESFHGILVFVSHDVNFLNNLATIVLDIDYGEIREYTGNYDRFNAQKNEIMSQKLQETKYLEKKIETMQRFVERFRNKPSKARQAMSRKRMIDKIELPDIKHSSRRSPKFIFDTKRASGKTVLKAKSISKAFGDNLVLFDVNLEVSRGEKVAIIGHNGIGKSTLLKIVLDKLHADDGEYEWGYEAQIGYFAQDHHEFLNENISALTWLAYATNQHNETALRSLLGQVLFSKEDCEKSILNLSGGEATRLILAKIMYERSNVLVLDEPTNHLDIESSAALAKALKAYDGTLILVSHDRHFVAEIANRVIAITDNGIVDYHGNYQAYLKYYGSDYLNKEWLLSQK